ncbi:hypothetical protein HY490_00215 [Candidatus Woesearchaeota archaeon]|nr:hypothetical protein [Candidatus Woesearchaeota archaeon]
MKQNIDFLSSKDLKPIMAFLRDWYGVDHKFDWGWYTAKERLFVISRDIEHIDLRELRVNAAGLYIGEWKNGELRLSLDGSQLFGPLASKNIITISDDELLAWLRGEELTSRWKEQGLVLLKHDNDFAGCGKIKEGKVLNFVPKIRRLMVAHPISHGMEEEHT